MAEKPSLQQLIEGSMKLQAAIDDEVAAVKATGKAIRDYGAGHELVLAAQEEERLATQRAEAIMQELIAESEEELVPKVFSGSPRSPQGGRLLVGLLVQRSDL